MFNPYPAIIASLYLAVLTQQHKHVILTRIRTSDTHNIQSPSLFSSNIQVPRYSNTEIVPREFVCGQALRKKNMLTYLVLHDKARFFPSSNNHKNPQKTNPPNSISPRSFTHIENSQISPPFFQSSPPTFTIYKKNPFYMQSKERNNKKNPAQSKFVPRIYIYIYTVVLYPDT